MLAGLDVAHEDLRLIIGQRIEAERNAAEASRRMEEAERVVQRWQMLAFDKGVSVEHFIPRCLSAMKISMMSSSVNRVGFGLLIFPASLSCCTTLDR